jgi:endoglucanase
MKRFDRRDFIKGAASAGALALMDPSRSLAAPAPALPEASASRLPRWRGFNLLEKFIASQENTTFRESDFAWMAEWGFNFVRLPMSYRCWSDPSDWRRIDERVMKEIDQALEFGRRYGIHVCMNFHRAPGYSVDHSLKEPFNLWKDAQALEACAYHWRHFAARYRAVPSRQLSFDLLNEPGMKDEATHELLDDATYARVVTALVEAIREESPDRLIIADGLSWGRIPVPALAPLGIAQSTRGYEPIELTHYRANWIEGSQAWPAPEWPLALPAGRLESFQRQLAEDRRIFHENPIVMRHARDGLASEPWGRQRLLDQLIAPWRELERMGVGVHVGEWGCFNQTPREACLGWMRDLLPCWRDAGWGWALWNLRGGFGILDSERPGVKYENFRGHQLDREMLELLQAH